MEKQLSPGMWMDSKSIWLSFRGPMPCQGLASPTFDPPAAVGCWMLLDALLSQEHSAAHRCSWMQHNAESQPGLAHKSQTALCLRRVASPLAIFCKQQPARRRSKHTAGKPGCGRNQWQSRALPRRRERCCWENLQWPYWSLSLADTK